jgi:hypothetical protein
VAMIESIRQNRERLVKTYTGVTHRTPKGPGGPSNTPASMKLAQATKTSKLRRAQAEASESTKKLQPMSCKASESIEF